MAFTPIEEDELRELFDIATPRDKRMSRHLDDVMPEMTRDDTARAAPLNFDTPCRGNA